MPPATLDAFRSHGVLRDSLEENVEDAQRILGDIGRAGISLDAVTDRLVDEGVELFADAADELLGVVAKKRMAVLGERVDAQTLTLGGRVETAVGEIEEDWRAKGLVRRLWRRDKTLWTNVDEDHWLGWLDSVDENLKQVGVYQAFAEEIKREGFKEAVLLGMGGSSLGPEVLARTLDHKSGWPRLRILDSTDPTEIAATRSAVDLANTLFIVSSKSGSTTEPNLLKDYFHSCVADAIGRDEAGRHFVAITDPGSPLDDMAKAEGFRRIFYGTPSIGGRYSVLSAFGLAPAAATGIDVASLLSAAQTMVRSCGPDVPPAANPGVRLGIALGAAGLDGRDKVTILASPQLADFGAWAEQLLAESTGKRGRGLIPVDSEPLGAPDVYGPDRLFIDMRTH
jgi:transaldolase / glucose-6-phosphate isomerase